MTRKTVIQSIHRHHLVIHQTVSFPSRAHSWIHCLASHCLPGWPSVCPGTVNRNDLIKKISSGETLLCYFPCLWFDTDKLGELESQVLKIVRNTRWRRLCQLKITWTLCEREIHFSGVGVIAHFEICLLIAGMTFNNICNLHRKALTAVQVSWEHFKTHHPHAC